MTGMILPAALVVCAAIWLAKWFICKRIDNITIRLDRCFDGVDKRLDNLAAEVRETKELLRHRAQG